MTITIRELYNKALEKEMELEEQNASIHYMKRQGKEQTQNDKEYTARLKAYSFALTTNFEELTGICYFDYDVEYRRNKIQNVWSEWE